MANAFDQRNFIPGKQETFYSVVSPSSSRPDVTNVLWEASSNSPRFQASPQSSSPRPNHPPPTYEESVFTKALAQHHHSPSLRSYSTQSSANSPNPGHGSFVSYSSPSTPNHSIHQRQPPPPPTDAYYALLSPRQAPIRSNDSHQRSSDTKPPPPARIPKVPPPPPTTMTTAVQRTNGLTQYSPNGMRTSTTYLNTTQLYISQPSRDQGAPPPPPRYPLHPPAIPPRGSPVCYQSPSGMLGDVHSSMSPRPTSQTIYRSPVVTSTVRRQDLSDAQSLERRLHSLSINNDEQHRAYVNGSYGQCHKCAEMFSSTDDTCEILGQIYHSSCAVCVVCGRSVKNKHYFVKDQLYCEEDFLYTGYHQTLEHCVACHHLITDTVLQALGHSYHLSCFKCSKCSLCLDGVPFITDKHKNLFCLHDYHMTYGPRCDKCSNPICPEENSNETVRIVSMGKTFHVQCYQCQDCSMQLSDELDRRCYPLGEILLCQGCCRRRLVSLHHQ